MNHIYAVGAGFVGVCLTYAFGETTELFRFFLVAMGIDIVTGIIASLVEGRGLSSAVGTKGLAKKAFMLLAFLLAHRLDVLWGTNTVMIGAIYAYLWVEIVSITENYARVGLPLPEFMRKALTVLKPKSGGGAQ